MNHIIREATLNRIHQGLFVEIIVALESLYKRVNLIEPHCNYNVNILCSARGAVNGTGNRAANIVHDAQLFERLNQQRKSFNHFMIHGHQAYVPSLRFFLVGRSLLRLRHFQVQYLLWLFARPSLFLVSSPTTQAILDQGMVPALLAYPQYRSIQHRPSTYSDALVRDVENVAT